MKFNRKCNHRFNSNNSTFSIQLSTGKSTNSRAPSLCCDRKMVSFEKSTVKDAVLPFTLTHHPPPPPLPPMLSIHGSASEIIPTPCSSPPPHFNIKQKERSKPIKHLIQYPLLKGNGENCQQLCKPTTDPILNKCETNQTNLNNYSVVIIK